MLGLHLKTIFSFRVYHRLALATKWQAAWFMVYLFLICLLGVNLFVGKYVNDQLPLLIKNFPQITFENGRMIAPQQPTLFEIPQSGMSVLFNAGLQTPPTKNDFINKSLAAVAGPDALYMPTAAGVQKQPWPQKINFTTTQELLNKHKDTLAGTINAMAFMSSFIIVPAMFLFFFCAAMTAGFLFRLISRQLVPLSLVAKWAVFLMGPLSALWLVHLFIGVPLFTLAVIIVCIIYMQQIFNTLPEAK